MTKLIFFALCISLTCCAQDQLINSNIKLAKILDSLDIKANFLDINIDKSEYLLSVMADTLILKQYPVVFGGNPVDDKRMQGDNCTPEGVFAVRSKYPHKSWSKFIWIDYPNAGSWKKFNEAKSKGLIPNDAKIGGEIGIHGVPAGSDRIIDAGYNWTLGCISLKNDDVNEIYPYISNKTMVTISN